MEAKINSQQGRLVEVEFTFDDNSKVTKKMDLQPNDAGDPFDDLQDFFRRYALAYIAGKAIEAQIPEQNFTGVILDLN